MKLQSWLRRGLNALVLLCATAGVADAAPFVFQLEGGLVNKKDTYANPTWDKIDLKYTYENPILLAIPNTNGGNPADFKVRNVTTTSFELTLAEPPSEDGPHVAMDIAYVAVEQGQWLLPDGQKIAAGAVNTATLVHSGGGGFQTINLPAGFTNPIVLAQLQSTNNEQNNLPSQASSPWFTVAVRNVTNTTFQLALDGCECTTMAPGMSEKIGWMAIDGGITSNFIDEDNVPVTYETIRTGNSITGWDNGGVGVGFSANFSAPPLFVAKLQSRNSADGGWPRFYGLSAGAVALLVDEDACQDGERSHPGEAAGLFVFSNSFRVQDEDPDKDGIASELDNCPLIANPGQEDVDNDDEGDVCDCGDGLIADIEMCDDENENNDDGCNSFCNIEQGWDCSGEPSVCTEICGDGLIVGNEGCDDDGTTGGDGCSATCEVEQGWECTGEPSECTPICGDGLIRGDEGCDDDNTAIDDGCSDICAVEPGWLCAGEPSLCQEICGDGLIVGEEGCDDGDLDPGDGCFQCVIEDGWSCAGEPSVCTPGCGDGIILGSEECDDANNDDGDGCSGVCVVEDGWSCEGEPSICTPGCGDGIVAGSEQCDDGNTQDGDGCSSTCQDETPGTGGGGAGGSSGAGGNLPGSYGFADDLTGRACGCSLPRSQSRMGLLALGAVLLLLVRRRIST